MGEGVGVGAWGLAQAVAVGATSDAQRATRCTSVASASRSEWSDARAQRGRRDLILMSFVNMHGCLLNGMNIVIIIIIIVICVDAMLAGPWTGPLLTAAD